MNIRFATTGWVRLPVLLVLAALICGLPAVGQQAPLTAKQYEEDFDTLWKEVAESYAYFDKKQTDWDKVRLRYRPQAEQVAGRAEFIALLERTLEELYDFHAGLNTNTAGSPVLVPTDADIWAEWRHGIAIVTEVRPRSPAARTGMRPGMEIVSINGTAVRTAVDARVGACLRRKGPEADNWALRTLLAGRHNETRRIGYRAGGVVGVKTMPVYRHDDEAASKSQGLLEWRVLRQNPAVGYIRVHNSLGDLGLISAFDKALAGLKSTKAVILDLRDTPSGGNTTVARGIMGRFISRTMPYQRHSLPAEERAYGVKRSWVEEASPRGPFRYAGRLVVLVDHWTGSMGEGITIGLDSMNRADTVGTEMARLLGATDGVTLPNSRIRVQFPTEKVFHVDGRPREAFVPHVYVDLLRPSAGRSGDPILQAGIAALQRAWK